MVRAARRIPSGSTTVSQTASIDDVDAAFLDTIRRVESEFYRRQIDRRRTREVIDLVSGLLSTDAPLARRSLREGSG